MKVQRWNIRKMEGMMRQMCTMCFGMRKMEPRRFPLPFPSR
jgi:hypothetical protein